MSDDQTNVIIFSFNRPMQLHACLESFYEHFKSDAKPTVTVIWKASTEEFQKGYALAAETFTKGEHLDWVEEDNFQVQVRHAVNASTSQFTMFLVDDIIFVNDVSTSDKQFNFVRSSEHMLALSLRLHGGITQCYATNEPSAIPTFTKGVAWIWSQCEGDWGYPMSVDGNVYTTELIKRFLTRGAFTNPNTFEVMLDTCSKLPGTPPYLCCYPEGPKLINIPANRVQDQYKNRFAEGLTPEEMNELYLSGKTIDTAVFAGVKPSTVHVPLTFSFKE